LVECDRNKKKTPTLGIYLNSTTVTALAELV